MDLRENKREFVKVIVRCRPMVKSEVEAGYTRFGFVISYTF